MARVPDSKSEHQGDKCLGGRARGHVEVGVERAEEGQQRGQDDKGEGDAVDAEVDADIEFAGIQLMSVLACIFAGWSWSKPIARRDRGDEDAPVMVTPWRSSAWSGDLPFRPGGPGGERRARRQGGRRRPHARKELHRGLVDIGQALLEGSSANPYGPAPVPVATRTAATARTREPASSALT